MTTPETKIWGGTTLDARRATRRAQLLDAGLELLGTQGSAAVTVRSVCRRAQLTDRYFYESFADRDALAVAVFDMVGDEAIGVLDDAVAACGPEPTAVATAAVDAFLDLLTADPRKGRVLLLEPMTDACLGPRAGALMPAFSRLVSTHLGSPAAATTTRLTATAVIGALGNLFIRWLDGSLGVSRDQLRAYCIAMLLVAAGAPEARRAGR